ncbi:MAG: site-specific integrase [Pirellulales bacterium]|nr:site-specific integrase [Pirellulales bacterium]
MEKSLARKRQAGAASAPVVPALVRAGGEKAARKFLEFFAAQIRNANTREAYTRAVASFLDWSESRGVRQLCEIQPIVVAGYIEDLLTAYAAPTVKQHLAAIRMLFDWLVVGHIIETNPASSVRGPKHIVKRGKTPVLTAGEARQLLDSIDVESVIGLRDRALIGLMVYSFARVSAAVSMQVEDYFQEGKRSWFRLREKGGKEHVVPAHHNAQAYLDGYLLAARIAGDNESPLFRTIDRHGRTTARGMTRNDALRMVKRRARQAAIPERICCHSFRATGITAYLENGGTIEHAQAIAAHESPRTTKLYDRTGDEITLDEIERILV